MGPITWILTFFVSIHIANAALPIKFGCSDGEKWVDDYIEYVCNVDSNGRSTTADGEA